MSHSQYHYTILKAKENREIFYHCPTYLIFVFARHRIFRPVKVVPKKSKITNCLAKNQHELVLESQIHIYFSTSTFYWDGASCFGWITWCFGVGIYGLFGIWDSVSDIFFTIFG